MHENDPPWRLRHALAGLVLALLLSVPLAALGGRWLGDSYAWRATSYAALLAYVVTGAVLLFLREAQHETRPLSAGRLVRWLLSLWLWPALLAWPRRR